MLHFIRADVACVQAEPYDQEVRMPRVIAEPLCPRCGKDGGQNLLYHSSPGMAASRFVCPHCVDALEVEVGHLAAAEDLAASLERRNHAYAETIESLKATVEKNFAATPVPMILYCPECGKRHIDAGEFATKSHHTHACQSCGCVWRPAVVATVGVQFLPGFKDE